MESLRRLKHPRSVHGFTLIEVLVAVAIVAIITAIALPSFQQSLRKSRRANAFAAVAAIQQSQERWRANNARFSTSLTDLKVGEPDLYTLSVSAPDAADATTLTTGYVVTAIGSGSQANDTQCRRLSLKLVDGNVSYAGCYDCASFDYQPTNVCWAR